jgi:hypothetical protein
VTLWDTRRHTSREYFTIARVPCPLFGWNVVLVICGVGDGCWTVLAYRAARRLCDTKDAMMSACLPPVRHQPVRIGGEVLIFRARTTDVYRFESTRSSVGLVI